ncbi:hypothetical protein, partial [Microlunatus capsulatus]|uniref:hypothetical protein n=1 Tax=Microlunatus capsulatus TaxID=99117 RepID=UPI0031DFC358
AAAVGAPARTGVGHWAEHVQAQTDADEQRVSVAEMDGIFARTRLAGPADLERWDDAREAHDDADGACAAVDGAAPAQTSALQRCADRDDAQRELVRAAGPAMGAWRDHLQDMMRSRMEDVPDAEQVWLDAWRAAPPAIEAFEEAERAYDPPRC